MYRLVRNTHLVLALLVIPFCAIYALSALQMSYRSVLKARSDRVTWQAPLDAPTGDADAVVAELRRRYGVRGDLLKQEDRPEGRRLTIVRPGTQYQVTLADDVANVSEKRYRFLGVLNRIHHVSGIWWETGVTNAWGAVLLVLSLALVTIGVTGVYLWFRLVPERRAGVVVLGASLLYSGGLLAWIRLS